MTDNAVSMKTPAGDFDYPVLDGTVGPEVVDIRKLYGQTGMSARSCSVRRSAGLRKKSRRTVDRRPRPAARAGAFRSAAVAAIGLSFDDIALALYASSINFQSIPAAGAAHAG